MFIIVPRTNKNCRFEFVNKNFMENAHCEKTYAWIKKNFLLQNSLLIPLYMSILNYPCVYMKHICTNLCRVLYVDLQIHTHMNI